MRARPPQTGEQSHTTEPGSSSAGLRPRFVVISSLRGGGRAGMGPPPILGRAVAPGRPLPGFVRLERVPCTGRSSSSTARCSSPARWRSSSPPPACRRAVVSEVVVLSLGLAAMLLTNAVLLRASLAPVDRVVREMGDVDLLEPGAGSPSRSAPVRRWSQLQRDARPARGRAQRQQRQGAGRPGGRAAPDRPGAARPGRAEPDRGAARAQAARAARARRPGARSWTWCARARGPGWTTYDGWRASCGPGCWRTSACTAR